MKRLSLLAAVALMGCISYGVAQNVNKSVQLSQDPSGPIGYDNQNGVYFPGKIYTNNNQTAPTAGSGCGTTPTVTGTATAGNIIEGTGTVSADGCGISFATAYPATPYCVASSNKSATPTGAFSTPGGIAFLHLGTAASLRINWICFGQQP